MLGVRCWDIVGHGGRDFRLTGMSEPWTQSGLLGSRFRAYFGLRIQDLGF